MLGAVGFDTRVRSLIGRWCCRFEGPGREAKVGFVADGAETIVRRAYEVSDDSLAGWTAGNRGRPLVLAHYKFELSRFREAVEREPGPRGEIEGRRETAQPAKRLEPLDFPVDEG